jgi:hypothetical protein
MTATIASAVPRRRTRLDGRIVSVQVCEHPFVHTDAVLDDATGSLLLRFVGRREIPGLAVGRRLQVEGTPGNVGGRLVVLNPFYSFVPS